jgi:hypothetical protein
LKVSGISWGFTLCNFISFSKIVGLHNKLFFFPLNWLSDCTGLLIILIGGVVAEMIHLYRWFSFLRGSMIDSFSIDVKRGRRDLKFAINAKGGVCWLVYTGLGFIIYVKLK